MSSVVTPNSSVIDVHTLRIDTGRASPTITQDMPIVVAAKRVGSMYTRIPRASNLPVGALQHPPAFPIALTPPEPNINRASLYWKNKDKSTFSSEMNELSAYEYTRLASAKKRAEIEAKARELRLSPSSVKGISPQEIRLGAKTALDTRLPIGKKSKKRDTPISSHLIPIPGTLGRSSLTPSPDTLLSPPLISTGTHTLEILSPSEMPRSSSSTGISSSMMRHPSMGPEILSHTLIPGEIVQVVLTPPVSRLEHREIVHLTLTDKPSFLTTPFQAPLLQ